MSDNVLATRPIGSATATFEAGGLRHALFLAVFTFFWVTSSPYVDLAAIEAAGNTTASTSNVLNQILTLTITVLLFSFALKSPLRPLLGQPRLLVGLLLGWYFIASAVSPHAADALKKTTLAALTVANASIFLSLPASDKAFAKLLLIGCFIMLGFAYFGVLFLPLRAIHQASEITEPMNAGMWRGQYTHKNVAAAVMLVAVFFGLFIQSAGYRLGGIVVCILSVFFLLHTGGKSSTAMLPAILVLAFIFERWKWTRPLIVFVGIAAFNLVALGAAQSQLFASFIKDLGVDPTFTNRTDIWRIAFNAIGESPIFGYGFQGFWQTPELANMPAGIETWAVKAFNGHNAYIDTLLTTGAPGLVLTMLFLLFLPYGTIEAAYASGNNPAVTRMFVRIWLYGIYASCLESNFFQSGSPVWFSLLFSIFGLRLQGLAHLNSARPGPTGATPRYV